MSKKLSQILVAAGISIIVSESNCTANSLGIEKEIIHNIQKDISSDLSFQDTSSENLLIKQEITPSYQENKLLPNLFLQNISESLFLEDGPQDFICTQSNGGCTNNASC